MNSQLICDHYVYVLKDSEGVIRYVGEGRLHRIGRKSGRPLKYLEILNSGGYTEFVETGLSKREALDLEKELISENKGTVINRVPSNHVKVINYEDVCNVLQIDLTSKTGLRWVTPPSNNCKSHAGGIDGRYYRLMLNGVKYLNHRIVWVLHNKKTLDDFLVVNHIDGDRYNNSPENLEAVSQKENIMKYHQKDCYEF